MSEGGRRQALACLQRQRTLPDTELLQHAGVLAGVGEHGHTQVILRRRAHHRWPADIDVFDDVLMIAARPRERGLERIKVADDQVDGPDLLGLEYGEVL